jgi:L,D-transpeptidase ErfK/SrfK
MLLIGDSAISLNGLAYSQHGPTMCHTPTPITQKETELLKMNGQRLRLEPPLLLLLMLTSGMPVAYGEPAPLERHEIPAANIHLLDRMRITTVDDEQTLLDVARQQGIGQEEIVRANPTSDRWLPTPGSTVVTLGGRLLPDVPRTGIVINLPEFRLYFYPRPATASTAPEVLTVPISVGRMDWKTPIGLTKIASKQKDPSWTPPESIRAEHEADGDTLPRVVPPGPDNPLGAYAMRLAIPGYLIHGTDKEFGVGMQVTHGCMRLLPEHIEALFGMVPVGTQVLLMNQPIKLGWGMGCLYLEVHPPLEEDVRSFELEVAETLTRINSMLVDRYDLALDETLVSTSIIEKSGLPVLIARPSFDTWQ